MPDEVHTAAAEDQFAFGPLAGTRALCPPPSLDEEITKQAPFVRGYLLKDGRLYLSLMADGASWRGSPSRSRTKGKEAQVTWLDEKLSCTSK